MSEIVFNASVVRVKTLVDGGIRLELDLGEDCIPQAAMMMECKREGIPLTFRANVEDEKPYKRQGNEHDRPRPNNR